MLVSSALIFAAVFLAGLGIQLLFHDQRRKRVQRRLQEVTHTRQTRVDPVILRDMKLSSVPALDRLLQRLPLVGRLPPLLAQADASFSVGTFVLLMMTLAVLGAFLSGDVFGRRWLAPFAALLLGSIPLAVMYTRKEKRMRRFEEQLPDALDLICGALRSGMAFTSALQLVADECPDPLAKEFNIAFEEHRLGLDMHDALTNMTRRVDRKELRLFVTAVTLQRETGGNLSEILEGAAEIIRDRFRILGDVRTITAQARLSGVVLVLLPVILAVLLGILVPDYMKILTQDPIGVYILYGAVGLQVIGWLAIRKITSIKV